jgi:hypothetical protein
VNFDFKKMLNRELNVGLKDQKIRYGVGCVSLLASVFLGNIPMLLLGGVLVTSAYLRWCPAYSGLGKSTVDPNEPASSGCSHVGEL